MTTVAHEDRTDIGSPWDFVPDDQQPVLRQLLGAVPGSRKLFDEGDVKAALRLVDEASHIKLSADVKDDYGRSITKHGFLLMVTIDMPYKYHDGILI